MTRRRSGPPRSIRTRRSPLSSGPGRNLIEPCIPVDLCDRQQCVINLLLSASRIWLVVSTCMVTVKPRIGTPRNVVLLLNLGEQVQLCIIVTGHARNRRKPPHLTGVLPCPTKCM